MKPMVSLLTLANAVLTAGRVLLSISAGCLMLLIAAPFIYIACVVLWSVLQAASGL
jgi:hypothetical protein